MDKGCSLEDLPEAMDDRDKWRERVREICACSMIWWWWYQFLQVFASFSLPCLLVVFHRNLRDIKSSQVSRNFLSILADLNNAVICIVLILYSDIQFLQFFFASFWELILAHQLISPSSSCWTVCFILFYVKIHVFVCLFAFFHSFWLCGQLEQKNPPAYMLFSC